MQGSYFDRVDQVLTHVLDALAFRQTLTANNIANVNTPGFKRAAFPFEQHLQQALSSSNNLPVVRTHPNHLAARGIDYKPSVVIDRRTTLRNDGNNVDIERESAQQAKDTLAYQAVIAQLNRRYSALRSVIHDGRR